MKCVLVLNNRCNNITLFYHFNNQYRADGS